MPRRLRAILAVSLIWGVAWATASAVFLVAAGVLASWFLSPDYFLAAGASWGIWGALTGASFGVLLTAAERRQTVEELSRSRVALWGAVGGAVMPLVTLGVAQIWPVIAVGGGVTIHLGGGPGTLASMLFSSSMGAASAVGQLAMARRIPAPAEVAALAAGRGELSP